MVRELNLEGYLVWNDPLHVSFLSFSVAASKETWVGEFQGDSTSAGGSDLVFTKPFNDREVEEVARLLCVQLRNQKLHLGISLGENLILDKLRRRGIALVNKCYLCQQSEELVEHLLIHCSKANCFGSYFFPFLAPLRSC